MEHEAIGTTERVKNFGILGGIFFGRGGPCKWNFHVFRNSRLRTDFGKYGYRPVVFCRGTESIRQVRWSESRGSPNLNFCNKWYNFLLPLNPTLRCASAHPCTPGPRPLHSYQPSRWPRRQCHSWYIHLPTHPPPLVVRDPSPVRRSRTAQLRAVPRLLTGKPRPPSQVSMSPIAYRISRKNSVPWQSMLMFRTVLALQLKPKTCFRSPWKRVVQMLLDRVTLLYNTQSITSNGFSCKWIEHEVQSFSNMNSLEGLESLISRLSGCKGL